MLPVALLCSFSSFRARSVIAAGFLLTLTTLAATVRPVRGQGDVPSAAARPPESPILRIDAGMHTGAIGRLSVDRQGRYLATCARDKTVRVWSLDDAHLLRTLRPPIGDGDEGVIDAVALSPDGSLIACGGATGFTWDGGGFSIYLFDRASGALVRRIGGLPRGVSGLAFSPDGRYLAVGLFADGGARVFKTADGAPIWSDKQFGSDVYGLDWDATNRLVLSSFDGAVRLYSPAPKLTRVAQTIPLPGGQPYSVRFSPDGGSRVAVAYNGVGTVSVLSGSKLTPLYRPDVSGVGAGQDLACICWSREGGILYAGGSATAGERRLLRVWSGGGEGAHHDVELAENSVLDLCALPSGSAARSGALVYASGEPSWGVLDATGRKRGIGQETPVADYRDDRASHLKVSADGATVGFGFHQYGVVPACIDVSGRELKMGAPATLAAPITDAVGLTVTGWKNDQHPTLNGRALPLTPNETARSLAIASDRQRFLLGTDWNLRCFSGGGLPLWSVPAPGVCWSVNVTPNGKVGVAAFDDGTIRWYRLRDGAELLDFFPDADHKRWVLWTPAGCYDCSPGGEDLIGWHINRGREQAADFYPASRFHDRYYRPDVTGQALSLSGSADVPSGGTNVPLAGGSPPGGARTVAAALPPIINILSPTDSALASGDTVLVRFTVRAPADAPVTTIRSLVDSRPAEGARGMNFSSVATASAQTAPDGSSVREMTVRIPARDCAVSLLAENKNAVSAPATVRVKWGHPTPVLDAGLLKPKLYVLAVGVSKYAISGQNLEFSAKDAADFVAAIKSQSGGLYRDVETKALTDEQATKNNVLDGLEWIQRQTTARDVAMVYLSGHGDDDPDGDYYFLTHDFDGTRWKSTAVSYRDIQETLKNIKGKALFFVDTCHAGGVDGVSGSRRRGMTPDINALSNDLTRAENGVVVFAASTGRQSALENRDWGNGAFTLALIEAITGKSRGVVAPANDALAAMTYLRSTGKATINSLDAYLAERVKQLTGGRQTPTTTKPQTIPDFPIAALH